jgi:hypothetical protein
MHKNPSKVTKKLMVFPFVKEIIQRWMQLKVKHEKKALHEKQRLCKKTIVMDWITKRVQDYGEWLPDNIRIEFEH